MDTRNASLLVNSQSRRGEEELASVSTRLQGYGISLTEIRCAPSEIDSAIRSHCQDIELVILAGGDGTMNAAAEALLDCGLPFGILPIGTANDLARTLGIAPDLMTACDIIGAGRLQQIDLGWVNGKHFFNVASMGISVEVTHRLTTEVKRRWGIMSYLYALVDAFKQNRPFRAEIICDQQKMEFHAIQITVGNGRYYGGGFSVAEDAAIDDQLLDLYALKPMTFWQIMRFAVAIYKGEHDRSYGKVYSLRGREIKINTRKSMTIDTDGELSTETPAHFKVIPRALTVCVPSVPEGQ